ncbi:MAG: DUF11 domain-containing protein [Actinomycetota bacterium]|nr:DUF11 domain-containing protein [Actinomycetota bacterium]
MTVMGSVGVAAVAAPAALALPRTAPAPAGYGGTATADLAHVAVADVGGFGKVVDATVAPAVTTVASTATPRVHTQAANTNTNLLTQGLLGDQLGAKQDALPDNATGAHNELLGPTDLSPLAKASALTSDVHARWPGDNVCLTTEPLGTAIEKAANAVVLPGAVAPGDAVSLNNTKDPSGASVSSTAIGITRQGTGNGGVYGSATTQITAANLLGGNIIVNVVNTPSAVVTATGTPGGATAVTTQPVLDVTIAGTKTTLLSGETLHPLNIPGAPVVTLTAGNVSTTKAADGTSASATGNLLTLKVLDVTGTLTLVDLTLGDLAVNVHVPSGGITCAGGGGGGGAGDDPLREARKDVSAASVDAGSTFNYTISVPNRGSSSLTNVTVTDTVGGTPPLQFVSSTPSGTNSGDTYTFSLGTIAVNQVKTVTITFKVPSGTANGTAYSNKATIAATYNGAPIEKPVSVSGPVVGGPASGACDLRRSTMYASNAKVTIGENFNYFIDIFNNGSQPCTNVLVTDTLPQGVQYVSCGAVPCGISGTTLTWHAGTVGPGASETVYVTVKTVAGPGDHRPDSAVITSSEGSRANVSTPGPLVTSISVLAPAIVPTRASTLPRTGFDPRIPAFGLLLLLGAGLVRRRALGTL